MSATLRDLVTSYLGPVKPTPPPAIRPVAAGEARPLWSVMIPTFNCARFLRQTLESVLREKMPADQMQIEVVDDVSTKDDPESVVRELGQGRVAFHRKAQNEGVSRNFNTCIARSRGQLVHILHGDDYVLPGFYARVTAVADQQPDTAAFFTRCRVVDEFGTLEELSTRLRRLETPTRSAGEMYYGNPIRTPGVVIRRAFYEKHGGFSITLSHVADWEMWTRVTHLGRAIWLNELLADYRHFSGNDTSRLVRTAGDLRERLQLALLFADRFDGFDLDRCVRDLSRQARRRMQQFRARGDEEAEAANREFYLAMTTEDRRSLHEQWDVEVGLAFGDAPDAQRNRELLGAARRARAASRRLLIWGAGQAGIACLRRLRQGGVVVDAFIDSDVRKHGTLLQDLPIVGPGNLQSGAVEATRPMVLIASMYAAAIARTLQGLGFAEERDYFVA